MQKKKHSFLEACLSTAIGFGISWALNVFVLRAWGFNVSTGEAFWIAIVFTVASIIRGYYVRRLFNFLHVKELL